MCLVITFTFWLTSMVTPGWKRVSSKGSSHYTEVSNYVFTMFNYKKQIRDFLNLI